MNSTRETLHQFINETFLFGRPDQILPDNESLVEGGVIDSTGVLQLVAFLERQCGITITDDEIIPENLDSIDRIVSFAERKVVCCA